MNLLSPPAPKNIRSATVKKPFGRNRQAYERSDLPERLQAPTREDLIKYLEDDVEGWADGIHQDDGGPWEIHCAVHLLKMLEGGAQ